MRSHASRFVTRRALLGLVIVFVGSLTATFAQDQPNPILAEMLGKGLDTGGGVLVKLPPPTMADGLNAAEQRKAILGITDPNKTIDRLLDKNENATFQYKITPAVANKNVFHIDMWYVAYGSLQVVAGKQFSERIGPCFSSGCTWSAGK